MIDDDEAYGLHCDIGRLEQENATLRQQLEDVTVSMGRLEERHAKTFEVGKRWMAKAARFESENAKLRELVRAFDWCTENFDTSNKCDQCPLAQSDRLVPECEIRMRELRVER